MKKTASQTKQKESRPLFRQNIIKTVSFLHAKNKAGVRKPAKKQCNILRKTYSSFHYKTAHSLLLFIACCRRDIIKHYEARSL